MPENPQPPSEEISAIARRWDLYIALAICVPALLVGFFADSHLWLAYYGNYLPSIALPLWLLAYCHSKPFFLTTTSLLINAIVWNLVYMYIHTERHPLFADNEYTYGFILTYYYIYAGWSIGWLAAFLIQRKISGCRAAIWVTLCGLLLPLPTAFAGFILAVSLWI